jgi:hypothetical protein
MNVTDININFNFLKCGFSDTNCFLYQIYSCGYGSNSAAVDKEEHTVRELD